MHKPTEPRSFVCVSPLPVYTLPYSDDLRPAGALNVAISLSSSNTQIYC